MAQELDDKVVLLTGCDRPEAVPVCRELIAGGAAVALAGPSIPMDILGRPDEPATITLDIPDRSDASWAAAVAAIAGRFGRLDAVVCLGRPDRRTAIATLDHATFQAETNRIVHSAFLAAKHGAQLMRQGGRGGTITALCGLTARIAGVGHSVATASDGGLRLLMKALALELGPENIRANAILAGTGAAPEGSGTLDAAALAAAVRFLVSDRAAYMTGADLTLDGGLLAGGIAIGGASNGYV